MKRYSFCICCIVFALLMCMSSTQVLYATDNEFGDMSLSDLMEVEVETATLSRQNIRLAPASIFVVTDQEIKRKGYTYLFEVLESLPQVQLHQRAGTAYYSSVTVRGINAINRFQILINGSKVNNTDGAFARVMYQYPVAHAAYIEINLTPSSTLFGADAFAGVINIVTKQKYDIAAAAIGYGMFGTFHASASMDKSFGDVRVSIMADVFHSDEPVLPDFYAENSQWYFEEYLKDSLMEGFGSPVKIDDVKPYAAPIDGTSLSASVYTDAVEAGVYFGRAKHSSATPYEPRRALAIEDSYLENTILAGYIRNTMEVSDAVNINNTIEWHRSELSPESHYRNIFSNYNRGYKYERSDETYLQSLLSWELDESSALTIGIGQKFVTSLPYTSDLPRAYDPTLSPNEQGLFYVGSETYDKDSVFLGIEQNFYTYEKQVFSSLLQYEYTVAEVFNLTAGARFDISSKYGNILNPRIGAAWMPDSTLSVKVNASRAYQDPSSQETYRHYGSFFPVIDTTIVVDPENGPYNQITGLGAGFWHLPNPDLQREIIDNVTLSLALVPSENFVVHAEVFYNDLNDLIVPVYEHNVVFEGVNVATVERSENAADAHSYGVSVEANYTNKLFENTSLFGEVSYDYVDGEYVNHPLIAAANHTIKIGIGAELYEDVCLHLESITLSDMRSQSTTPEKPIVEGSTVLNGSLSYQFTEKLCVKLRATNLLDNRFYGPVWQSSAQRAPQNPFRLIGRLEVKL